MRHPFFDLLTCQLLLNTCYFPGNFLIDGQAAGDMIDDVLVPRELAFMGKANKQKKQRDNQHSISQAKYYEEKKIEGVFREQLAGKY